MTCTFAPSIEGALFWSGPVVCLLVSGHASMLLWRAQAKAGRVLALGTGLLVHAQVAERRLHHMQVY